MGTIKDNAVVLRRLDFSETSQVLALFTRGHGKVRAIAKGIKRSTKRRFAAAVDLLDVGHVVLSARGPQQEKLAILTEWTQTRVHSGLRARLDRLYGAQYAAGLTAELTADWDPHPVLFDELVALLEALAEADRSLPVVVRYQRRLLEEIGSVPIFDACVGCGRAMPTAGDIHFSSLEGGLLCRDCEPARAEKLGVDRRALGWLRGRTGDGAGLRRAYQTFDYHLSHLMGRPHPLGKAYLASC